MAKLLLGLVSVTWDDSDISSRDISFSALDVQSFLCKIQSQIQISGFRRLQDRMNSPQIVAASMEFCEEMGIETLGKNLLLLKYLLNF